MVGDTAAIARGEKIFTQDCSACHGFKQDGIGPQLGGITASVSGDWIKVLLKNPQAFIESGDVRAYGIVFPLQNLHALFFPLRRPAGG